MSLPVENVLPALAQCFPAARVVLEAPPGADKSTFLPLYLLREQLGTHGITVMLQPRRVAAVNVASYLSRQLGEQVGETVGYIVRGETKRSKSTESRQTACQKASKVMRESITAGEGSERAYINSTMTTHSIFNNRVPSNGTTLPRLRSVAAARAVPRTDGSRTRVGALSPGLAAPIPS